MIRTNLIKPRVSSQIEAKVSSLKPLVIKILLACFVIQILYFGVRYHLHGLKVKELQPLKTQLSFLKQSQPTTATDTGVLAASVKELNEWFDQKNKSIAKYISLIETNKPIGIEIQKIEISKDHGRILMLAPDMNYSARFANSVFRGVTGNLSLIEKTMEGFIIQYQWTN